MIRAWPDILYNRTHNSNLYQVEEVKNGPIDFNNYLLLAGREQPVNNTSVLLQLLLVTATVQHLQGWKR